MNNRAQILIRAVDETRGAFDSIKRGLGRLADAARSVNGVLAGLGVALSAAGLTAMVKSALDSADALNKLSQRVGITVESLSTLMPAAELSGVSAQTFETGLQKLATTMFEAATSSEESARRFTALGVEFRNQYGALRATDAVCSIWPSALRPCPMGRRSRRWPSSSPERAARSSSRHRRLGRAAARLSDSSGVGGQGFMVR
jgi:hypothetical protein